MKSTILTIALIMISFVGSAQQKKRLCYEKPTVSHPNTENQITKEDALNDESANEFKERDFEGVEEDSAFLNQDFREREALKKGKITDPEREINTFDYDKIFFTDISDFKKAEQEEKAKAIKEKEAIKPKK